MLDAMSWEQLQEWSHYDQLEPFGEQRADLRTGIIASTIANANRTKKTKPFKPSDFMPKFDEVKAPTKPRTAEQFRREFDEFKAAVKATAGSR